MAIHESQSLFVEKQIARSPEFWEWAMPHVREHLGDDAIAGWELEDVLAHVHLIERGLIRVDADEATYPLHVILRYEIEQDLIEGALAPRDVPEAWDAKMREYLGLSTIDNMKDGPMQDVHWPSGAIGYFPSYTLGAHDRGAAMGRRSRRRSRRARRHAAMAASSASTTGGATTSGARRASTRRPTCWSARPARS